MIELNNLEIKYGDFTAIKHIDLSINEGEFFTFLGPSGCGKTTTLRAVAGFLEPSRGTIIIDKQNVTHIPVEKRGVGMVFQSYALFPTMTVYDNIAYGLRVERYSKQEIEQRVQELAQIVDLSTEQLNKNVSDLSGGQQQRVAIARALAKKPAIMLFDEPLSNLDAKLRKQLRSVLKRIQRETKMTAVYVTHDQEEALELSDRIAVFNGGVIDQIGTPQEIYNHSKTEFVCNFIGEANLLGNDLIELINQKLNRQQFDVNKRQYLRQEKIKFWQKEGDTESLKFEADVLDSTFFGESTTYICQIGNTLFKTFDKNDLNRQINVGEKLTLFINPQDILEYEV